MNVLLRRSVMNEMPSGFPEVKFIIAAIPPRLWEGSKPMMRGNFAQFGESNQ